MAEVPTWALTHLTHASLQRTAVRAGVDMLHIKGPATRTSLRAGRHDSSDADVLVRPSHLTRYVRALTEDGWALFTDFDEGSPFGHAANYRHPSWTYADVHRLVPGTRATPAEVFDILWNERESAHIGHHECMVLSLRGQVVMQALHAARSHGAEVADAWTLCPEDVRPSARMLAAELQAETAFAAGIGELHTRREASDFALWEFWSGKDTGRLDEWLARYRSATSMRERMRVIGQSVHVNRTHLRIRLEREPTWWDITREQISRAALAVKSAVGHAFRRGASS